MPNDTATDIVFFPINQDEQAKQRSAKNLVAQDVFKKIAAFLEAGLKKIANLPDLDDLDEHRAHEAILLQGGRGTGKSAILVNLQLYLDARTIFAKDLLILKPIDPTLLEDGKDMFLDIFIAALVRDKQVKAKLDKGGRDAEVFYDQLCKVGNALESAQSQQEQRGMDKVRALIGSSGIAEQIHKLFQCTLTLTGKKLIVLPIDDVDTALQHAYEKIEIVRKYLVSPYVIPLISGDLDLYNDVIWRNFHGRLLTDSRAENFQAIARAKQLSIDYQRKILPLPRRIEVEKLSTYLSDWNLVLSDNGQEIMPFPLLKFWLDAIINERVGENSGLALQLPINSMREFAQLVSHVKNPLGNFPKILLDNFSEMTLVKPVAVSIAIRRLSFMNPAIAKIVAQFEREFPVERHLRGDSKRRSLTERAYSAFQERVKSLPDSLNNGLHSVVAEWQDALNEYFKFHHNGGAIYLILEANRHFRNCASEKNGNSSKIFDTDLFKPTKQSEYKTAKKIDSFQDEWEKFFRMRIPESWLRYFPKNCIFSFSLPEVGNPIFDIGVKLIEEGIDFLGRSNSEVAEDALLIFNLMVSSGFHNPRARAPLVFTGRVFELVVISLIRNVVAEDIYGLIRRVPFYSILDVVQQKTPYSERDEFVQIVDADINSINKLVSQINDWRKENSWSLGSPVNAWLLKKVFDEYFDRIHSFADPKPIDVKRVFRDVYEVALQAFDALWVSFARIEKCEIFGFDDIVVDLKISEGYRDFSKSQLYSQNIQPFLRSDNSDKDFSDDSTKFFDFRTGAYTYMLASHPLRRLLRNGYESMVAKNDIANGRVGTSDQTNTTETNLTKSFSVLERRDLNVALSRALRKTPGQNMTKEDIGKASINEIVAIVEMVRDKLSTGSSVWLDHFDNILSYSLENAGSSIGKIQRMALRINMENVKNSNKLR